MNRIKFLVAVLGLAFLLSALHVNGIARAEMPVPLVTFIYQRTSTIQNGRVWTDASGMHIRNRVDLGSLTGDLAGYARVVYNADLVFNAGADQTVMPPDDGTAFGTIEMFSSNLETAAPIWSGTWSYNLQDGKVVSGSLSADHVSGTLKLIVFSVTQGRGGIIHSGYFDPGPCLSPICGDPAQK